jgi:DNA-directed RNA polymerase alpha subunit
MTSLSIGELHAGVSSTEMAATAGARPCNKITSKSYRCVKTTIVNALRRIVIAEIPYIATFRDDERNVAAAGGFVVRSNTGRLHDDMLMDRLALVPIHLTREEVLNFIPGSITIDLCVANESKFVREVTSADIRPKLFGKLHPKGKACYPPCAVTRQHALITRLYPGEKIDLTATLEKGTPTTHAAFAVASHVAIDFGLDRDAYDAKMQSIIADHANSSERERARAINHLEYIGRHRLIERNSHGDPTVTTLRVESECGLSGSDIISFAEQELVRKFTTDNISFDVRQENDGVSLTVHKQGHTFGSVLQEVCMRDREALGIASVGYFITHPLENTITVRVALAEVGPGMQSEDYDHGALFARMRVHCARHVQSALDERCDIEGSSSGGGRPPASSKEELL